MWFDAIYFHAQKRHMSPKCWSCWKIKSFWCRCPGDLSVRIPVLSPRTAFDPLRWSATVYPGDLHPLSVTVHICSPVLSSVALYELHLNVETPQRRLTYEAGKFVLLCNPWLKGWCLKLLCFCVHTSSLLLLHCRRSSVHAAGRPAGGVRPE